MVKQKQNTIIRVSEPTELMPFLLSKLGGMTRTSIKALLAHRQVLVNKVVRTRHDTPLQEGDEITILTGRGNSELRHPKLKIIYEDDHLIVVDKKEGLLTVATHPGSTEMTVFSILKAYVKKQNPRNGIYVVHRLDRETSGVLVFAKSPQLQHYMREYWRELVTKRTYLAVAEGLFEEKKGTIRSWFTEDKKNAVVYSSPVDDGGALAITHYEVVRDTAGKSSDDRPDYSLVELHLETGRTNQIRVHLASKGHPVVGDRKYGHGNEPDYMAFPKTIGADRLCLHAKGLEFIHPANEQVVHFESPVPKVFNKLL